MENGQGQPPSTSGTEAYGSAEHIRAMEQHSEVAESPREQLARVQTLKAQVTNDLNSISTAGTQDLSGIQQVVSGIAQALDIPEADLQELVTRAESDWQGAFDAIAAKLEEVQSLEQQLAERVTNEPQQGGSPRPQGQQAALPNEEIPYSTMEEEQQSP